MVAMWAEAVKAAFWGGLLAILSAIAIQIVYVLSIKARFYTEVPVVSAAEQKSQPFLLQTKNRASLKFYGGGTSADVVLGGGNGNQEPTNRMYFLNTNYLELIAHRDANWTVDDEKVSINQDAVVIPMFWQGQLVCSNRNLQGILIDAA